MNVRPCEMRGLTFWPEGTGRSASSGSVTVVGSFAAHGKPTGGQNILFGFDNLSAKNKAVKTTRHRFSCLGASVSCRSTFQPQSSDPLWEPDFKNSLPLLPRSQQKQKRNRRPQRLLQIPVLWEVILLRHRTPHRDR